MVIDGRKDDERRRAVEMAQAIPGMPAFLVEGATFLPYRKTTLTYAVQVAEAFEVHTIEGVHSGKAGDYLAIGAAGEMYPIDIDVFEATYERVEP